METERQAQPAPTQPEISATPTRQPAAIKTAHEMECPVCGHSMPDLKGGKATICAVCGFKDSCCF